MMSIKKASDISEAFLIVLCLYAECKKQIIQFSERCSLHVVVNACKYYSEENGSPVDYKM